MNKVNWPEFFNPETQRAYLDANGNAVFMTIPREVKEIAYIEPSEGADPFEGRVRRATELAVKGIVIDVQIDVWGWGAENTMRLRRMYGKVTVPDAFGKVQILVPPAK